MTSEVEIMKRQIAALMRAQRAMEASNSALREQVDELREYKVTIESEREANRVLTEELEALRKKYIELQAEIGRLIPPVDGERANDPIINRVRRYVGGQK